MDPTRTAGLRRAWHAELRRRFERVKRLVRALVLEEDAFGLAVNQVLVNCGGKGGKPGPCPDLGKIDPGQSSVGHHLKTAMEELGLEHRQIEYAGGAKQVQKYLKKKGVVIGEDDLREENLRQWRDRQEKAKQYLPEGQSKPSYPQATGQEREYAAAVKGKAFVKDGAWRNSKSPSVTKHVPREAILGGQYSGVFTKTVEAKIKEHESLSKDQIRSKPRAFGIQLPNGKVVLQDGHHTAEALLRAGHASVPISVLQPPVANAGRFAFLSTPDQLKAFREWLARLLASEVVGRTEDELWRRYVEEGFKRGQGRVWSDFKSKADPEYLGKPEGFFEGTREEFLRSSFVRPVAVEKVQILASRVFTDLKGITDAMAASMTRVLADGLVQGLSPRDVARDLAEQVDVSRSRAEKIARTETIRAHAEGQLQALEDLGVAEVGVQVEWLATADTITCPRCREMEGQVFAITNATGLIPLHPNCRCAWIPAGEAITGNRRLAAWNSLNKVMALERHLSPADRELRRLLLNAGRQR